MNKLNRKSSALFVLCLSAFLVPFMGSAMNLALPQIGERFSMNAVALGWIATIYLLSTAIFQIPLARLADMVGRKKMFIWGLAIFSLSNMLGALAQTSGQFIAMRALCGVGSAMIFGTNMAILTSIFSPAERGRVLGINTAVVYFALASGPFLGGILTQYLGWQSLFWVCAATGVMAGGCSLKFLRGEWIEARGEKFDFVGAAVYAVALFGVIFGFSKLPSTQGFIWLGAGVVSFVIFTFYELRCSSPIFDMKIFSGNKIFSLASISALINYAATSAVAFIISLYLQYVRGLDAQHAGFTLIIQALIQTVVALWAGRLTSRFPSSALATTGMAIIVAGLTGLIFITTTTPIIVIVALLSLLGFGFGLFSSPNVNVIMSSVGKRHYGQASASTGTMRLTGQAFSMGIAMMAISLQVGDRAITAEVFPEFMRSVHITFIICAVLCLAGAYASSFNIKNEKLLQKSTQPGQ